MSIDWSFYAIFLGVAVILTGFGLSLRFTGLGWWLKRNEKEAKDAPWRWKQNEKASALNDDSVDLLDEGNPEKAEGLLSEALQLIRPTSSTYAELHVTILFNLAVLRAANAKNAEAKSLLEEALGLLSPPLHQLYPRLLYQLAVAKYALGKVAAAQIDFKNALAAHETPNEKAALQGEFAQMLFETGHLDEAEKLLAEARIVDCTFSGELPQGYANRLETTILVHMEKGEFAEADRLLPEALEIAARSHGKKHPEYVALLFHCINVLENTNRSIEAEPFYREAIEIAGKTKGKMHPDYACVVNDFAGLLQRTNRYDEAETLLREVLSLVARSRGETDPDYARSLNNLAALLADTNRPNEARPLFLEAVAVVEAALGPEHINAKTARANLELFLDEAS